MVYVKTVMNHGSLVCSYNEWDPLEEVIVGRGLPTTLPALDFTFRLFFHDNIYNITRDASSCTTSALTPQKQIKKRHIAEHEEDVESFANLLASHGITVKRPKVPRKVCKIKTTNWESEAHPALNVRDLSMIVGNKIIETPPSLRFRYFENDYLKHLFLDYFKHGAEWIVSPRPLMLNDSFDLSYYHKDTTSYDHEQMNEYMSCGYEIMFDAANCMRLGTTILFNSSSKNSDLGAVWLQQQLGDQYNVTTVNLTDTHIDSTFIPLRPGVALLLNPDARSRLPEYLQSWDLIEVPLRNRTSRDMQDQSIKLASPRIELNVLSIDTHTIICHPEYQSVLQSKLKKYKFDVIPARMRHCEIFAGAHHCLTLDVRRNGKLENYFDET